MSSEPGRARRLESAISICLLAVLLLIVIGVFVKQSNVDMSRFGIEAAAIPKPEIPVDLGLLTPAGFETLSTTEIYDSGNLYEKINGKATLYLDSGFKRLLTQRFVNKDDENLWMELFVYDMDNIANAFSVYSTQKRPDVEMLSFAYPRFHYKTGNGLYFVHGKYYVEAVGSSESTKLLSATVDIAQKISDVLAPHADTKTLEVEMALFPKENIVPGSIKLYLTSTFGFEGLTDTFAAKYKCGDETVTVFFSKRATAKEARKIAESYYQFLVESGGVEKPPSLPRKLPGRVIDVYGTTEIVFAVGPFVAGVHEAETQQCASELADRLFGKLSKEAMAINK
jgi:hypothetical protein